MMASEFAQLLSAKRTGRGRWAAKCPHHSDRRPSLSISEGKRRPILFRCQSQGCSPTDILKAMGLTWADILGPRTMTPEIRRKLKDQEKLKRLEGQWMAASMNRVWDRPSRNYWAKVATNLDAEIIKLRDKLDPPIPAAKIYSTIERFGWPAIWKRYLETDRGAAVSKQWSLPSPRPAYSPEYDPLTIPNESPIPSVDGYAW